MPENPRAFPSAAIDDRYGGMSLRDAFAMAALTGFCSCTMEDGDPIMGAADTAKAAYNYADAMLAQRSSGQGVE